jgi:ABC-2 type transport system ATP-binding protein
MIPEEIYLPDVAIPNLIKFHSELYPLFQPGQFQEYLDEFEIPVSQSLLQMSYGQKKKVVISLGLSSNTPLLLMDEPTNGLDIISKSQFRKIISGILNEERCMIISTHQVRDLENLIDRIMIIDSAQILFDQMIDEIARKLSFKFTSEDIAFPDAFYSESTISGKASVMANDGQDETKVDLELLYKTIMANPQKIRSLFNA